jgi:hypothetical protein
MVASHPDVHLPNAVLDAGGEQRVYAIGHVAQFGYYSR